MQVETFTAQIFVGLRIGYTSTVLPADMAKAVCQTYCSEVGLCVTFTPTEFIYKPSDECPHYGEPGVIVGLINYPRFPSSPLTVQERAEELALRLKGALGQNRVSIVYPQQTLML